MKKLIQFFKDEDGAQMTEYVVVLALIVIVAWIGYQFLGEQISTAVSQVGASIAEIVNG